MSGVSHFYLCHRGRKHDCRQRDPVWFDTGRDTAALRRLKRCLESYTRVWVRARNVHGQFQDALEYTTVPKKRELQKKAFCWKSTMRIRRRMHLH